MTALGSVGSRFLAANKVLRALVVLILVAVVLVGLWWLNDRLGLGHFVAVSSETVRAFWLPLIFLLVCVNFALGWAFWSLLTADWEASEFPDIDQAWAEARVNLDRAGIGLDNAPLFLVLGEPGGGGSSLFQASRLPLQVVDVPRRPDAPLHVFSDRDAIYVTCPGASVLGRLAEMLGVDAGAGTDPQESATARLPDVAGEGAATTAAVAPQPPATAETTPASARSALLSQTAEIDRSSRRLRRLCALIARDRRPFCPANGILLVVPFAATADDADARQAGSICSLDVTTVLDALRINCPVFALVCDLETAPNFPLMLQSFPPDERLKSLGRSFPLVPDLDVLGRVRMVEAGVEWIGKALVTPTAYRLFRIESGGEADAVEVVGTNRRLFQFLAETHDRWRRLGRLLGRVVQLDTRGSLMLGGCFLAATGTDPDRQQGFVAGVLSRMIEAQDYVSWNGEALRHDELATRRAILGNIAVVGLVVAVAVIVYAVFNA
jgi:hypothetical protein